MRERIKIKINKKEWRTEGGTVIQSCEKKGIGIPRLCYSTRLTIAGNCRMCLVEVDKGKKSEPACAIKVRKGMEIRTRTRKVIEERRRVIELILINHPLDCPICDKGGECDLQDVTIGIGKKRTRYREEKRAVIEEGIGIRSKVIGTVMTRCIHCTRCIRYIGEIGGERKWGCTGRGGKMTVTTYIERGIRKGIEGNMIEICPVGALTEKNISYKYRPWEIKRRYTIEMNDSWLKEIRWDIRGKKSIRIGPATTRIMITDKTRMMYDGIEINRIIGSYKRRKKKWREKKIEKEIRRKRWIRTYGKALSIEKYIKKWKENITENKRNRSVGYKEKKDRWKWW